MEEKFDHCKILSRLIYNDKKSSYIKRFWEKQNSFIHLISKKYFNHINIYKIFFVKDK